MGDPNTAARDSIFWLHHSDIDRLWERWLDRGDGHVNPGVTYEVYLNLPEREQPDYRSDYYVGNVGFFGPDPTAERGGTPRKARYRENTAVAVASGRKALDRVCVGSVPGVRRDRPEQG